jgi:hypothetical protein
MASEAPFESKRRVPKERARLQSCRVKKTLRMVAVTASGFGRFTGLALRLRRNVIFVIVGIPPKPISAIMRDPYLHGGVGGVVREVADLNMDCIIRPEPGPALSARNMAACGRGISQSGDV